MASSSLGYYTRFDESLCRDEDPVDTGIAYRAINNLNHLADQCSQHRINWIVPAGDTGLEIDPEDSLNTSDDFFLYKSAAFDMPVRADGTTYRAGIWLYAHSGHASWQASFNAVLAPAAPGGEAPEVDLVADDVNVVTCSATSTSFAWLQCDALAYLDSRMVSRAAVEETTVDSIGGTLVGVRWLRVRLYVYMSVTNVAADPRLGGVRLVEFYPP